MSTPASDLNAAGITLRMPRQEARAEGLEQDEEWCELLHADGTVERLRFHDYDRIFDVPGLYEKLFYEELECSSPTVVRELLASQLSAAGASAADLRILDLGAGNGMVAEELKRMGIGDIVGLDILDEAREAAVRDRPEVYGAYHVCDLTDPSAEVDDALAEFAPTGLTTVAALGFGDIPPRAFANAFDYLAADAWIAMTIKDDFLTDEDPSGFSRLIRRMNDEGTLELVIDHRYQHRLAVSGEPLFYHAYIARKRGEIAREWVEELESATA